MCNIFHFSSNKKHEQYYSILTVYSTDPRSLPRSPVRLATAALAVALWPMTIGTAITGMR